MMDKIRSLFISSRSKRSIRFYKYFVSYIFLVILILVIMGYIVYHNFITILQREVESSNLTALEKVCETVDSRLMEMGRLAINISENYTLSYSSFVGDGYNYAKCVEELKKYSSGNIFMHDILLYYKARDNQRIYTTNGVYDLDTLFNSIYVYQDWGKQEFLDMLSVMDEPYVRPVGPVLVNNINTEKFLTYVYPIPVRSIKPQGAVLFLIKNSNIYDIIKNSMKEYNGYIYILDDKNRPVFSNYSGLADNQPLHILENIDIDSINKGTTQINIDNEYFSISRTTSEYNGWSYVTLMNTDQFLYKVNTPQKIFMWTVLVVFALGVVIAFIFSSNQYNALRSLADTLKRQVNKDNTADINDRDEIKFISRSIEAISKENTGLSTQLRSSMKRARSQFLMSLLKGEGQNKGLQMEVLGNFDIKMEEGNNVTVLLFVIDNYESFKKNNEKDMEDLVKFSVINVMEELSKSLGDGYGVDLMESGQIAVIVNTKPGADSKNLMIELIDIAKAFFKQHYDITFTVGVGGSYDSLSMIKKSYREASRAISYRLIKGRDQVILYNELKADGNANYSYPVAYDQKLQVAIKQADVLQAENVINELMKEIACRDVTPEMAMSIYYGIINGIIKVIDEMKLEICNCIDLNLDQYLVAQFETIEDFKNILVDFCNRICYFIEAQKEEKNVKLIEEMITFLHENYSDSNLCLEVIADNFNISPSYSSKIFKANTGFSIMQYIDNYRMEKARMLLKNTDLGLREILDSVGYVDKVNFIRKFKKNEGLTPIQYRSIYGIGGGK